MRVSLITPYQPVPSPRADPRDFECPNPVYVGCFSRTGHCSVYLETKLKRVIPRRVSRGAFVQRSLHHLNATEGPVGNGGDSAGKELGSRTLRPGVSAAGFILRRGSSRKTCFPQSSSLSPSPLVCVSLSLSREHDRCHLEPRTRVTNLRTTRPQAGYLAELRLSETFNLMMVHEDERPTVPDEAKL